MTTVLGKGVCEMLADAGAAVVVSDRDIEKALKVANQINDTAGRAFAIQCNVLDDQHLVRLVETTVGKFGGLHILVNHAGGGVEVGKILLMWI